MPIQNAIRDENGVEVLLAESETSAGETRRIKATDAGALNVNLNTTIAGEDVSNDVLKTEFRYSYWRGNTAGTTTVKAAPSLLHRVVIGKGATSATVTVYDNTSATGNTISVIDASAPSSLEFNIQTLTGLTVVISGTPDVTVVYR
jgi:hypothetical protein